MKPAKPPLFACYFTSTPGRKAIGALVTAASWDEEEVYSGGILAAARMMDGQVPAHTIVAELENVPLDAALEAVRDLSRGGCRVFLFGESNDINLYRSLMNAGATDYFSLPLDTEDVLGAVRRALSHGERDREATTIGVVGAIGGVGASMLAQNLAWSASGPERKRTALVDLDFRFGGAAADLDCRFTPGLFDALKAPSRVDEAFLNSSMEEVDDRVLVYSGQAHLGHSVSEFDEGVGDFLSTMAGFFETVVADMPREILLDDPEVVRKLDHLIIVIAPGYSALNAYSRIVRHLHGAVPDLAVVPVLSELRKDAGLGKRDIERAVEAPLKHILPRADAAVAKAVNKGLPVVRVQAQSAYGKAANRLWRDLGSSARTSSPLNPLGPRKERRSLRRQVPLKVVAGADR